MAVKPLKNIFILLFFFVAACSCGIKACPAQSAQTVSNETNAYQAKQVPNTELERVQPIAAAGGQMAVQKNFASYELLSVAVFHPAGIAAESSFIKASSLLVKDHLIHNYPSHNFW